MTDFDRTLMLLLNFDGGQWLGDVMQFASARLAWLPLYALLIFLLFRRLGWKRALIAIAFIVVGIVVADNLCNLFKNTWNIPRPTHSDLLPQLHNIVSLGSKWGTASSHAANTFFIFSFVSLLYKRQWLTWTLFGWTLLVCYSRIYLGLHFPLQIALGIAIGGIIGIILLGIYRKWVVTASK